MALIKFAKFRFAHERLAHQYRSRNRRMSERELTEEKERRLFLDARHSSPPVVFRKEIGEREGEDIKETESYLCLAMS